MSEKDGWNYSGHPKDGQDARCLVTLTEGGMILIGIRAWNAEHRYWMNGGEPERLAKVKAWRELPEIANIQCRECARIRARLCMRRIRASRRLRGGK